MLVAVVQHARVLLAVDLQAEHWQADPATAPLPDAQSASTKRRGSSSHRPTLYLTIDSAEHLPAAEALIAAMYGAPNILNSLQEQQLVQAVVIADMVHAEAAAEQAVSALKAEAESEQGLSAAALDALAGLPAWPARLVQLVPAIVKHAPCCRHAIADLPTITAADAADVTGFNGCSWQC
jgi:hypothetical protein